MTRSCIPSASATPGPRPEAIPHGSFTLEREVDAETAPVSKAEALAVVERALEASDWTRPDGCPTVPDRWLRNVRYEWSPPSGVDQEPVALELQAGLDDLPSQVELGGREVAHAQRGYDAGCSSVKLRSLAPGAVRADNR